MGGEEAKAGAAKLYAATSDGYLLKSHTVDASEIRRENQLRLVVYPKDLQGFCTSKRWFSRPIPEFACKLPAGCSEWRIRTLRGWTFSPRWINVGFFVKISVFGEHFDMLKKVINYIN